MAARSKTPRRIYAEAALLTMSGARLRSLGCLRRSRPERRLKSWEETNRETPLLCPECMLVHYQWNWPIVEQQVFADVSQQFRGVAVKIEEAKKAMVKQPTLPSA